MCEAVCPGVCSASLALYPHEYPEYQGDSGQEKAHKRLAEPGCWLDGSAGSNGCCPASPGSCLAVCCLVLGYNLLGGFLFLALEGSAIHSTPEDTAVAASKPDLSQARMQRLTSATVDRLWAITEDLNILYKDNWTQLAAQELMDFQRALVGTADPASGRLEHRWTFASSFLYALTLITTIGHGHLAPSSTAGRLVAMVYACVGIPVVMVYLSTLGQALALGFRRLYGRLRGARRLHSASAALVPPASGALADRQTPFQSALNLGTLAAARGARSCSCSCSCRDHARVPVSLSCALIVLYVALGTLLFRTTEKWSILDGCYFSLCTLATIGWGDLRPGLHARSVSATAEDIALGACCAYILVGIVVVAMCFNLIREDIQWALQTRRRSQVQAAHKPLPERVEVS